MHFFANRLLKISLLIVVDILCAALAVYLSVFVRFVIDFSALPSGAIEKIVLILGYWLPINFLIFVFFRMYNRLWEFASILEALRVVAAAF